MALLLGYIGPGPGWSMVGALLGLVCTVLAAGSFVVVPAFLLFYFVLSDRKDDAEDPDGASEMDDETRGEQPG